MKILSITAQKPFDTGSGVYLAELIKAFQRQGHKNALICGIYHDDQKRFTGQVPVYPVVFQSPELDFPISGMSDVMPYKSQRYRDLSLDQRTVLKSAFKKRLQEALDKEKPDLILCHHLYALTSLVAESVRDIPVYGICHGSDLRQIRQNAIGREDIKEGIRRLQGIFCLHEAQKRDIAALYGLPEENIHVIGAGYNKEIFKRNGMSKQDEVIFAGKISEKKGVLSLLKAMREVPGKKCVLAGGAGDQDAYRRIQEEAKKLQGRAVFKGKLDQKSLADAFNRAKVFVLPSFYEGLPLVALEALSCGCQVVMTDLEGIKGWYDAFLPGHDITFVTPPRMQDVDTPVATDLPAFEDRLAKAIRDAFQKPDQQKDTTKASWDSVAERILKGAHL